MISIVMQLIPILIGFNVLAIFIGVPLGITFICLAADKDDLVVKKSLNRKGLWILLTPIFLLFAIVVCWGIVQVIVNA